MSRKRKDAHLVLVSAVPWDIEERPLPSASDPSLFTIEMHFTDQEGLVSARSELRTGTARQMVKRFISRLREVKPLRSELKRSTAKMESRLRPFFESILSDLNEKDTKKSALLQTEVLDLSDPELSTCGRTLEEREKILNERAAIATAEEDGPMLLHAVDRHLVLDPEDGELWAIKGRIMQDMGRIWDVLEFFERAHRLCPDSMDILSDYALTLLTDGHMEKAVEAFDQLLKEEPENWDALIGKANALYQMNRPHEEFLEQARKLDPQRTERFMKDLWMDEKLPRYEGGEGYQSSRPHEMWQMGYMSMGEVHMLAILDDFNGMSISGELVEELTVESVRNILEEAFEDCGMPERILTQSGQPFFDEEGRSMLSHFLEPVGVEHLSPSAEMGTHKLVDMFKFVLSRTPLEL